MRLWPPRFGAPIFKLVSSCSLLVLCGALWAVDYQALDQRLSSATDTKQAVEILRSVRSDVDDALRQEIEDLGDEPNANQVDQIKWDVAQRGMRQGVVDADPSGTVKQIKANPLFQDDQDRQESNWLGKAFDRLRGMFRGKDSNPPPKWNAPNIGAASTSWVVPIVWVLLGAAIAAFAYFALRQVSFKKGLKRRRTAVLEEHEPDRTLDEWLAQADLLASQGRYREAVRALYLACLLKFDEKRVARFIRAETNWEHLARIQASPLLPASLDFRPATQAFDLVWYGHRVEGEPDVSRFRVWYMDVKTALEARP